MAKLDIRSLNYITSSGKQNTFNIDFAYTDDGHIKSKQQLMPDNFVSARTRTFFGDVGEEESMSQKYKTNIESLYDINNKIIIHNLYDLSKTKLKSGTAIGATEQKVDLFVPEVSDDLLDMCQFENFAYGLTKRMNNNPAVLSTCMNYKTKIDYSYHREYVTDGIIHTHLYNMLYRDLIYDISSGLIEMGYDRSKIDSIIPQISTYNLYVLSGGLPELSAERVEKALTVKRNIQNIRYNYLLEFPENSEYNQYDKGYIQCNTFIAKNDLDYTYSMDISSNINKHSLSSGPFDFGLYKTRDYVGLGTCGGSLFMKYRDIISYPISSHQYLGEAGGVLQHSFSNEVSGKYSYQHVEVVASLNRFGTTDAGHKSSLYSIRLNNTGLNSSGIAEATKSKLRQNITNSIRVIAEKICPANTQLFNVYFEGK